MKWLCYALLCFGCAGCSGLPLPSLDLCEQVRYERIGREVSLEARCRVP